MTDPALNAHPLPWRVSHPLSTSILDANGERVCQCGHPRTAEFIVDSVNGREGLEAKCAQLAQANARLATIANDQADKTLLRAGALRLKEQLDAALSATDSGLRAKVKEMQSALLRMESQVAAALREKAECEKTMAVLRATPADRGG